MPFNAWPDDISSQSGFRSLYAYAATASQPHFKRKPLSIPPSIIGSRSSVPAASFSSSLLFSFSSFAVFFFLLCQAHNARWDRYLPRLFPALFKNEIEEICPSRAIFPEISEFTFSPEISEFPEVFKKEGKGLGIDVCAPCVCEGEDRPRLNHNSIIDLNEFI